MRSVVIRLLLLSAWLSALAALIVVALGSYGMTEGAMLAWTVIAAPAAWANVRWLTTLGRRPRRQTLRAITATWIALVVLLGVLVAVIRYRLLPIGAVFRWSDVSTLIYGVFPLGVSIWGIGSAFRTDARRTRLAAEAV